MSSSSEEMWGLAAVAAVGAAVAAVVVRLPDSELRPRVFALPTLIRSPELVTLAATLRSLTQLSFPKSILSVPLSCDISVPRTHLLPLCRCAWRCLPRPRVAHEGNTVTCSAAPSAEAK